jgi:DNA-binding NarL/FixJ family response regulator
MIRLLSIEDHWLVQEGLKQKLRSDRDGILVSCSVDDIESALKLDDCQFDIILLDLFIPDSDPVDNVSKLKFKFPDKPIIILTSEESSVWRDQMCEQGIQAYLTKHDSRKDVKDVIIRVASGEDCCKARKIELQKRRLITNDNNDIPVLKPFERKVISFLVNDKTSKEIASEVHITPSAVVKIFAKLRKQFNVKTNGALLQVLINNKLISPHNTDKVQ